ncbi:transcription antitermination factor NusB [Candidatus Curtissbacteria bacterium RBG_16_39_7]|uniref:Transcription antitermination factor NusB n=1 Tax=Candidatus Curtissbacteria bacterium RBG_16_39_7 TaxID=1797707 RepID=A0A1F5G2U1_9BACT|nr:MAG: transcription antitermination factor NusB [Candidatus Curtissbacteria bacterium RBG_16_39_7]
MKKKQDPRHLERIKAMQELFAWLFTPNQKPQSKLAQATIKKLKVINPLIEKHAPCWPLETVSSLDLSILRLAVWELLFKKTKTPYKVVIDEAVELGKEFGSDTTSAFVNGVLGSIVEKEKIGQRKND